MTRPASISLLATLWLALVPVHAGAAASVPPPRGQQERVELRVSRVEPRGVVFVDRGTRDGLALGDLVLFYPRDTGTVRGDVIRISERDAVVELHDKTLILVPGTRGAALVPPSRLRPQKTPPSVPTKPDEAPQALPWESTDEGYQPGLPLLAQVDAVRPAQRQMHVRGRVYFIYDQTWTGNTDRSDSFLRAGTALDFENPFGYGGELRVDAEMNYRWTELFDQLENEKELDLRVDGLSYIHGGNRFEDTRIEVGRFLQYGLPEFGLLDGIEWQRRRKNGDSYGASLGFMPEPDQDLDTFDDVQLAAFYNWRPRSDGRLTLGVGFQKSFHNGDADRDLLVTKVHYFPEQGWDFHATTFVDFYTPGENQKESAELTQALVSTGRRWDDGSGVNVVLRHFTFPLLDRNEFLFVDAGQIDDDHAERLSVSGWRPLGQDRRLHGRLGGFVDEDEFGADVELGCEFEDLFWRGGTVDLTIFGNLAEFSDVLGGYVSYTHPTDVGRWNVFYEVANHNQENFSSAVDDVFQQRIRAQSEIYTASSWSFSVYAEGRFWDDEPSWSMGVFVQRSF